MGQVLGITNRGKKITNGGRDIKSGQRDFKSKERLQTGAKEIIKWGLQSEIAKYFHFND